MTQDPKVLDEMLTKAYWLIDALENHIHKGYIKYQDSKEQERVKEFYDEMSQLGFDQPLDDPGPDQEEEDQIMDRLYATYVTHVCRNIDQAVADGILKSGTECEDYSYMSKEGFVERMKNDPSFLKQFVGLPE